MRTRNACTHPRARANTACARRCTAQSQTVAAERHGPRGEGDQLSGRAYDAMRAATRDARPTRAAGPRGPQDSGRPPAHVKHDAGRRQSETNASAQQGSSAHAEPLCTAPAGNSTRRVANATGACLTTGSNGGTSRKDHAVKRCDTLSTRGGGAADACMPRREPPHARHATHSRTTEKTERPTRARHDASHRMRHATHSRTTLRRRSGRRVHVTTRATVCATRRIRALLRRRSGSGPHVGSQLIHMRRVRMSLEFASRQAARTDSHVGSRIHSCEEKAAWPTVCTAHTTSPRTCPLDTLG